MQCSECRRWSQVEQIVKKPAGPYYWGECTSIAMKSRIRERGRRLSEEFITTRSDFGCNKGEKPG